MAGIVVLGNRGSERTYSLLRLSFNSFLRSFSTDVPPNPNTSPSTNKIKKWMKNKKTLFEVAQFLPNWGIGYHVAKTRWSSGLSYEITKIDVYEDGIHGKAWGIPHKTKRGLHSTDAPRKMSEANKRIWKYLPNLGNAKKKSADPNVEEKSTDPKVEAA